MPLTRKQKWRINKVQSEKIARADKASIKAESDLSANDKEYIGKVITRYGQRQLVEAKNGEVFQSVSRQILAFLLQVMKSCFKKQNKTRQLSLPSTQEELNYKEKIN